MLTLAQEIGRIQNHHLYGTVRGIQGLLLEISGIEHHTSIGSRLIIDGRSGQRVVCEVVGFRDNTLLAMPYNALDGIGIGCKAYLQQSETVLRPSNAWLGRVINAFGEPIDGKGPIGEGLHAVSVKASPPLASTRQRVGSKIDLGVRALNSFASCCEGQRMGIFAGSGVGKSVLMSMISRYSSAEVNVIGLIGERGREVQEFIEDDLGPEGLARSVVIVATSDESALMRRQAAYATMAVSEYFRDQGAHVMCLMDSITRFAMAQREIGLAGGEPPTSKGYTPTVFSELPRLLERAGPGPKGVGNITGLFTVLVDGDDHNEPVADAVRGILDGHIVMERAIAERGRYPAINVLKSVSRTMPACNSGHENLLIREAKRYLSIYNDMEEMIRLGAYRPGTNPEVDAAIQYFAPFEEFLGQWKEDSSTLPETYQLMEQILMMGPAAEALTAAQVA
ncbi:flagellar protein export ATPase FliI [Temperatibacter marinus]|uniref:Flagellum-specific ATP synthase n=1 Tax=Temperatibacter marinus TaxID=1456591 RepID=A0AA52HAH6_9PROT|nr:flagellar protein export ATPase FliI [Temperatibacter marinus]WND02750.1 flagellar protein export ATPase FliI [Temperatibacter marinus]